MPDQTKVVVTNTTPLIALTAATGNLEVICSLYARVIVPFEVAAEIRAGGKDAFGLDVFEQASWLEISRSPRSANRPRQAQKNNLERDVFCRAATFG
jgi:predicted nucleic acid-binding protein